MGRVEWAGVGYLVLLAILLMREEITWLFSVLFLIVLGLVTAVFMYGLTND